MMVRVTTQDMALNAGAMEIMKERHASVGIVENNSVYVSICTRTRVTCVRIMF